MIASLSSFGIPDLVWIGILFLFFFGIPAALVLSIVFLINRRSKKPPPPPFQKTADVNKEQ